MTPYSTMMWVAHHWKAALPLYALACFVVMPLFSRVRRKVFGTVEYDLYAGAVAFFLAIVYWVVGETTDLNLDAATPYVVGGTVLLLVGYNVKRIKRVGVSLGIVFLQAIFSPFMPGLFLISPIARRLGLEVRIVSD